MNMLFNAAIIIENEMFFSAKNYNGLFKMNFEDNDVEFLGYFPGDKVWTEYMHQYAVKMGREIVFFPFNASNITKYNIDTHKIDILNNFEIYQNFGISNVLEYEGNVIAVPRRLSDPITVFSNEEGEIKYKFIELSSEKLYNLYCDINSGVIVGDDLYVAIYASKTILKIGLRNKLISYINLMEINICSATFYDDKFWMVSADGRAVCVYSRQFDFIKKYEFDSVTSRPYEYWMIYNDSLYLCGCTESKLLKYNVSSDEWVDILHKDFMWLDSRWAYMCGYQVVDHLIYIFPSSINSLLILDNDKVYEKDVLYYNDKMLEEAKREKQIYYFDASKERLCIEGQDITLCEMLDYLANVK